MKLKASIYSSVALVGIAFSGAAQAQQAPDGNAGAPAVHQPVNEQEIIVTARKRSERLQDVPAAITAVSSEQIARYSSNSINQISTQVPQLQVGQVSGPGGGSINLRGIGSPGTSPSVDQAVSINIDGIQVSQGNAISMGIYDLDRVEVLKGPQALFYGKNSLGGIISLVSADPGRKLEWKLRGSYDFEAHRQQYEGMVSVPINQNLGVRIDGAFGAQDGYFYNTLANVPGNVGTQTSRGPNGTDYFFRGTLKYQSDDNRFGAKLKVAVANKNLDTSLASNSQVYYCPLGVPQLQLYAGNTSGVNDCSLNRNAPAPRISAAVAASDPYYFRNGDPFFEQRQFLSSLQLDFKPADKVSLTSVTGYYHYKERWDWNVSEGEVESLDTAARVEDEQITQEVRATTSFEFPFNVVTGAYYQNSKKHFDAPLVETGFLTGNTGPLVLTDDRFRQSTTAYSFFAQGVLTLSRQLEMTGGGRLSYEDKSLQALRYPSLLSGFSPTPVAIALNPSKVHFQNFSPEATIRYRPNRDITIYGAYRQGFTSGGFNTAPATAGGDLTYRQATAEGFEAGIKGSLFDHQLTFDTSIYTYKYNDLQLNAFDPVSVSVTVRNAASARTKGAEMALAFSPHGVPGLTLKANVAYNHARYLSYLDAACYAGQSIAQGCNRNLVARTNPLTGASLGSSYSSQDLSGAPLERAPDWTMSHGFSYETSLGRTKKLMFGGDASYTSSFMPDSTHNPHAWQTAVWRLNAFATVSSQNDGWQLSLIGRNLANKLRMQTSYEYPLTGASYPGYATPGLGADLAGAPTEPRSITLQLTVKSTIMQ
ncbi:TonB-dependent receptor [Novosphingobium rosa]|uniref:TonB-dependent receptor n=1 Tax=Novosphingobium rosa TaxID=76978 RepID=UPI000835CC05|nr:TonB-dependent receptor [Novosphingobium rosa]